MSPRGEESPRYAALPVAAESAKNSREDGDRWADGPKERYRRVESETAGTLYDGARTGTTEREKSSRDPN